MLFFILLQWDIVTNQTKGRKIQRHWVSEMNHINAKGLN